MTMKLTTCYPKPNITVTATRPVARRTVLVARVWLSHAH